MAWADVKMSHSWVGFQGAFRNNKHLLFDISPKGTMHCRIYFYIRCFQPFIVLQNERVCFGKVGRAGTHETRACRSLRSFLLR